MATVLEQPKTTDIENWSSAVKGDTKAFEQIVINNQSAVSAVAFSIVGDFAISQDIAQETFWAAWKSKDNLRDANRLSAWLCGIARNLARQWNRSKSRRQEVAAEKFGSEFDALANDPADDFVSKEEESVVWNALETIPQNYREVLVLYYRKEQSIGEVAESLGISNDAARQRLSRGREILRAKVSKMIEGVLDRTNPSRSFTSRVMAGIVSAGVVGSSTSAKAGVSLAFNSSAASTAATTAKLLGTGSTLGLAGGMLGGAIGLLGAWIGVSIPALMAPTETERQLLIERGRFAMRFCILLTFFIFALCFVFIAFPNLWASWLIIFLASNAVFITVITVHGIRTQKLVRKLRRELSPDEDPNRSGYGKKYREREKNRPLLFGRRFTSGATLFGLPLLDIQISDPIRMNGTVKTADAPIASTAKGWIAIGDRALGVVALGGRTTGIISIGGVAAGGIAIGGLSVGMLSFGGLALGLFAVGGGAVGFDAIGGAAIAWHSATGGGAIAWHAAAGGGALAHDFAVGGGAIANEANTEFARQVIDKTCYMELVKNSGLVTAIAVVGGFLPLMMQNLFYTRTPPE